MKVYIVKGNNEGILFGVYSSRRRANRRKEEMDRTDGGSHVWEADIDRDIPFDPC